MPVEGCNIDSFLNLDDILEDMEEAFYYLDSNWQCRIVNKKAILLLRKEKSELIGKVIWDVFPELREGIVWELYNKASVENIPVLFEAFFETCNLWLAVKVLPRHGGISVYLTDISQSKKDILETRKIEQVFELFAKMSPAGLFYANREGKCLFVNERWLELTGLTATEAEHSDWVNAIHGEGDNIRWQEAIMAGGIINDTYQLRNKRTEVNSHVHVMAAPIYSEHNVQQGYAGIIDDITEKKLAHDIMLESERWLRSLVDNAPVMIWTTDTNRRCNYINNTWLNFVGKPYNGIALNWTEDIFIEDQTRIWQIFSTAFENKSKFRTECRLRFKDGSYRWVSASGKPLYGPDKTFLGYTASFADIDEQVTVFKDLERMVNERTKELSIALEREKELNAVKSWFVSIASHQLRTPLSTILSSAGLIDTYLGLAQFQNIEKHTDRIKIAVRHMINVLEDFLSLEKLEEGKVQVFKSLFSLKELCQEIIVGLEPTMTEGQSIIYNYSGAQYVYSDSKIIYNVIVNILSNAIKYSKSEILLDVIVDPGNVSISVADSGIGIPVEEQEKLFGKYYRGSNVGSVKGTGLGLNIAKQYVELLNGNISFISEQGKGSIFTIYLPVAG